MENLKKILKSDLFLYIGIFTERALYYGSKLLMLFYLWTSSHNNGLGIDMNSSNQVIILWVGVFDLFLILAGYLIDKIFGPYKILLYSCIFDAFGFSILLITKNTFFLSIALLFLAIGAGFNYTATNGIINRKYRNNSVFLENVFIVRLIAVNFGSIVGVTIAKKLINSYSFNTFFLIAIIIMLMLFFSYIIYFKKHLQVLALNWPISENRAKKIRKYIVIASVVSFFIYWFFLYDAFKKNVNFVILFITCFAVILVYFGIHQNHKENIKNNVGHRTKYIIFTGILVIFYSIQNGVAINMSVSFFSQNVSEHLSNLIIIHPADVSLIDPAITMLTLILLMIINSRKKHIHKLIYLDKIMLCVILAFISFMIMVWATYQYDVFNGVSKMNPIIPIVSLIVFTISEALVFIYLPTYMVLLFDPKFSTMAQSILIALVGLGSTIDALGVIQRTFNRDPFTIFFTYGTFCLIFSTSIYIFLKNNAHIK